MASTNFKIFAESASTIMSDAEYEADTQRTNGVVPGIAEPELHNKLYKQASMMAAAFAQVLVERGYNALDTDYTGLVANIKRAFPVSVNGKTAGADGDIDYRLLSFNDVYPVGIVITTMDNTNPSTKFGGTWEKVAAGRCLIGAGSGYTAGTMGGEATHTITVAELPSHNHSASSGDAGAHTHTGSSAGAGGHTHTISLNAAEGHKHNRGTMEITGTFGQLDSCSATGAFSRVSGCYEDIKTGNSSRDGIAFKASDAWTGETSLAGEHTHTASINSVADHSHTVTINSVANHNHSVSIGNTGSGNAMNNMQPYLVVYFWKRTA